jgi:hypothetical protein
MSLLLTLFKLYEIVKPFLSQLTPENIAALEAMFTKCVADYKGGDYAALIADLVAGLKQILPAGAHPKLDEAIA